MIIQEMNLHIEHRSGKSDVNADALSRNPIYEDSRTAESDSPSSYGTPNTTAREGENSEIHRNIGILQRQDPQLSTLITFLEERELPDDPKLASQMNGVRAKSV